MRLHLSTLFLLVLAVAVGLAVSIFPLPRFNALATHHALTESHLRDIRLWSDWYQSGRSESLSFSDFDTASMWRDIGHDSKVDSWGNEIQLVDRKEIGVFGFSTQLHAFSKGADGESKSFGNDLDDINSWSYDSSNYYDKLLMAKWRIECLTRSLIYTPIIFATLYLLRFLVIARANGGSGRLQFE